MSIAENIAAFHRMIPERVLLVAVSKTQPANILMQAYEAGQRHFGENKVQELVEKQAVLPGDIQWHFIGHLQTNKVKKIAPFVHLIHSIDSQKLLSEVNRRATENHRVIDVLLQFHIAEEDTKFGFDISEAHTVLNSDEFKAMKNVRIRGVMGMATFTNNRDQIHREFKTLMTYYNTIKSVYFINNGSFNEISMGMTDDMDIAIEEGSTMVRIGTALFGSRQYKTE